VKPIVLAGLLAVLLLPGCGGDPDPGLTPAGQSQLELLEDLYNGRFDEAYENLHPEHQKLVSLALFERCGRETIAVGQLDTLEILSVYDERIRVPALGEQDTTAVLIGLTLTNGLVSEPFENHAIEVDDRWVWLLNEKAVRAYAKDRCPT
jgi:hypothetical protein